MFDQTQTNAFYFAVWSRDGDLLKTSSTPPVAIPYPKGNYGDTRTHLRTRGSFREAFHFTERRHCILVGHSIAAQLDASRRFAWWLGGIGAAILALGLGGSWLLVSRALRPVRDISTAAARISEGNLSQRINIAETESELGRLGGVLNSTFARLEAAFAEQKQFTADASHELRTPLAVLISEAQTALSRDRTAAEYRATVEECLDTAQQMRRLTESLLQLARFDAGQEIMQKSAFDLADASRRSVKLIQPLAAERGIQIQCDLEPTQLRADPDRLTQVITNLLTNAINYNQEHGEIRISTYSANGSAILTVRDTGQGIAKEDLPVIFDRFYRADKSRARSNGRSGLAISKAIIEAHGGVITVSSNPAPARPSLSPSRFLRLNLNLIPNPQFRLNVPATEKGRVE